nr:hypothetical protein [Thiocapsa sp. KS1]
MSLKLCRGPSAVKGGSIARSQHACAGPAWLRGSDSL